MADSGERPPDAGPTAAGGQGAARPAWTGGRVSAAVVGALLAVAAVGFLAGGGVLLWADRTQREDGYLTTEPRYYETGGYALVADAVRLDSGPGALGARMLGDVRVRATGIDPQEAVFVGIGRDEQVHGYLAGVRRSILGQDPENSPYASPRPGGAPTVRPADAGVWTEQSRGRGTRTLVWPARDGHWWIVAMNADGSPGVGVEADVGATVPALPWIAAGLLAGGTVLLAVGAGTIAVPVRRASRSSRAGPGDPGPGGPGSGSADPGPGPGPARSGGHGGPA
ncbi:hypothetical protein GQS52_25280 [Streptomyces sp. SCUT-3]|uniref:hypothetical protein n=1 Tax=Streptomyces sp. SCUT-3 TaxID=2684469 RepID=UPI0015FE0356|nr:hypothetical protein [Streptomyces sp. SCUT-3]QMV24536.1 hypothetical protein GQS52_25280 [Streptomyces sp. SCUT-3]